MGTLVLLAVVAVLAGASVALGAGGPNTPEVTKEQAPEVTKETAKLTATVNPDGHEVTSCVFKYGTSPGSLGSSAECTPKPGSGNMPETVSAEVTGLTPNTPYFFQVVAINGEGPTEGEPVSFKTEANAPVATTGKAGEIKLTSAQLEGTVNPEGVTATCEFEWGTSMGSLTSKAPCSPQPGSGTSPVTVTAQATGLTPHTTYYFRLVAEGEGRKTEGAVGKLETLPDELAVTTGKATVVEKRGATLNGEVNPGGSPVQNCHFDYGTAAGALTSHAACSALPPTGSSPVGVSAAVGGLAPNTTYFFKLVAENETGVPVEGAESQLTTQRNPPAVTTGEATAVTQTSATLPGMVNPEGEEVTGCAVKYGTTPSLGSSAPCASLPGAGKMPIEVAAQVTGLSPGTTYYFLVVAESAGGAEVNTEEIKTFTTQVTRPTPQPEQKPPPTGPTTPKGPEPARPPVISSLSESNSVFRVGRTSTAPAGRISRVSPTGTVFSFVLDQPAVVTVAFVREESGHRIGKSCVVGRRGAGKPACVRTYVAMMLGRRAANGLNRLLFTGRVRGRALQPGAYRATFIGESLAGSSTPSTISFRVVAH